MGRFPLTETSWVHQFDLGSHFVGKIHQGRVVVQNDSPALVAIENFISSCSCTLAQASERNIPPGEKQYLLVQIKKGGLGSFMEKVDVRLAGRVHEIKLRGTMLPRISFADPIRFSKDQVSSIRLDIHDKAIDTDDIELEILGGQLSIADRQNLESRIVATLKRTDKHRFMDNVTVIPTITAKGEEQRLDPLVVPVSFSGVVRAVPKTVFVRKGKLVRLFLIGDVKQLVDQSETANGKVTISTELESTDGKHLQRELIADVKPMNRTAALTFSEGWGEIPRGKYTAEAICGSVNFRFRVQVDTD